MRYLSVCSGIEAASVAWQPLGWTPVAFSEIEPFPCALLAHHYPDVPNWGDMTTIARRVLCGEVEAPDVLTGGTPCQAFSVAGLRESLADERGNLTLKFVELADAIDHVRGRAGKPAAIAVWENVPGVLSTKDNAFGCFLAGLAGEDDALEPPGGRWSDSGCVYGPRRAVAWRTLDAQYFGLAQRRRRVFVVASARRGFDPAQVLFEWQGVRRDSAPSRQAGQRPTGTLSARTEGGGGLGTDFELGGGLIHAFGGGNTGGAIDVGACLTRHGGRMDFDSETFIAHSLRGEGLDASEDGTGRGTPLVPVAFGWQNSSSQGDSVSAFTSPTLDKSKTPAVALALRGRAGGATAELGDEVGNALRASTGGGDKAHVLAAMQVRRLTPRECERLQGFGDDYTLIPWRGKPAEECPDGPRYRALGNSWAVPVARWVGQRIAQHLEAA